MKVPPNFKTISILFSFLAFLPVFAHGQSSAIIVPQPKMGEPLSGLGTSELANFERGKRAFEHRVTESEGLGPSFNDVSCANCHNHPALGGASIGLSMSVRRFGRVDANGTFDPLNSKGGSLLQGRGLFLQDSNSNFLMCSEMIPPEANVITTRISTPMFGLGLVESISDTTLAYLEKNHSPEVSGIVHPVSALERPSLVRAGRFGWKAQVATSLSFAADAALNEMGVTNRLLPTENAPNGNSSLLASCDHVADPENLNFEGTQFIDAISNFQRYLAAPPQTPQSGMRGETKFKEIGCTSCHVPSISTSFSSSLEIPLTGKIIKPYSDFLLHDMGSAANGGLGDGIQQGAASAREMRTAPLWGLVGRLFLGHSAVASTSFMMGAPCFPGSDCSEQSRSFAEMNLDNAVTNVVRFHAAPDSESALSANKYLALNEIDRRDIIKFLLSLGRAPFDASYDGKIDNFDLQRFRNCFFKTAISANDECTVFDLNANQKIDQPEAEAFVRVYQGQRGDCNCNGISDPLDILTRLVSDDNRDGIPDQCSPNPLGSVLTSCSRPALAFNYAGEHVEFPVRDSTVLARDGEGFSAAFWVKIKEFSAGKSQVLLDNPGTFRITLSSSTPKRLNFEVSSTSPNSILKAVQVIPFPSDLVTNQWMHIGASVKNVSAQRIVTLKVNDLFYTQTIGALFPIDVSTQPIFLGDSPQSGAFTKSEIANLVIFRRGLENVELQNLAVAKPNFQDPNLVVYPDFASITGSSISDLSSNKNVGTLNGPDVSYPTKASKFVPSRSGNIFTLNWTATDNNAGDMRYLVTNVVNGTPGSSYEVNSSSLNLTSPLEGATYIFSITSEDGSGNRSKASQYSMINESIPPATPTGLRYARRSDGTLSVIWSRSADNVRVAGFRVTIYKNNSYLSNSFVDTNSFNLSASDPRSTYTINVVAIDQAGNASPASSVLTVPAT